MNRKILASGVAGLLVSLAFAVPAAAVEPYEIDIATGGSGNAQGCVTVTLPGSPDVVVGSACFARDGDVFEAYDHRSDGHSVAVRWDNFVNGTLYRHGACVEKRGAGRNGHCNKNFTEGSVLQYQACTWESGTDTAVRCGNPTRVTNNN